MDVWIRWKLDSTKSSQHGTRDEDEQDAQSCRSDKSYQRSNKGALVQQLSNVGLANWGPIHKGIFTVAQERHDGVDLVLIRDDEVCSDSKWKDDLELN
mgnify:FL=1